MLYSSNNMDMMFIVQIEINELTLRGKKQQHTHVTIGRHLTGWLTDEINTYYNVDFTLNIGDRIALIY